MVWLIEVVSFPPPPPHLLINILLYTLISTFLASGCLYLLELSEETLVKPYTLYYDKYCRYKLLTRLVIISCLQNSIKNPAWHHRWWSGEWAASCMHGINSGKSHHNRVTKLDHKKKIIISLSNTICVFQGVSFSGSVFCLLSDVLKWGLLTKTQRKQDLSLVSHIQKKNQPFLLAEETVRNNLYNFYRSFRGLHLLLLTSHALYPQGEIGHLDNERESCKF